MTRLIDSNGKTVPTVTAEDMANHNTGLYTCDCGDHTKRQGGSYYWKNERVCKHMFTKRHLHRQAQQSRQPVQTAPIRHQAPASLHWLKYLELA